MNDLKPCPFCGGEAHIVVNRRLYSKGLYGVECGSCPGSTLTVRHTEAEAIAAWNTRAERTCRIVKASRKYVLSDGTELFEDGCSECNTYIGEGDNYCSRCGAKVVGE